MTTLSTAVQSAKACTIEIDDFRIIRRGRFWVVKDVRDAIVVTAVYKKGALEVVRRLLPPEKQHLTGEVRWKRLSALAQLPRSRYSTHSC